jgi:hypothetical protein
MDAQVYCPEKISFMVYGVEWSQDLGDGEVSIERKETSKERVTLTGRPLFSCDPASKHAKIKFKLIQTSKLNALLDLASKNHIGFPIVVSDMNTGNSYGSKEAYVIKPASLKFGKDDDMEWELSATYLQSAVVVRAV